MLTEEEILKTLDNSNDGFYCRFFDLGNTYSYLIDSRINLFRNESDQWAIAVERLGYNPRAGNIILEIHYYGNCLINLEQHNNRPTNNSMIYPIDLDSFVGSLDDGKELKPDAKFWLVRGKQVELSHNKIDYANANVELKEYEPNAIGIEEAARLLIIKHHELFRATDEELYKSIPENLKKIFVIDEWYHRDFLLQISPEMTDEHMKHVYEFNKNLTGLGGQSYESFASTFRQHQIKADDWNRKEWENNRPGAYETWQQIAKVIATGNPDYYKPTLAPNSYWKNWQESGSM
jgi:hypothetical protein